MKHYFLLDFRSSVSFGVMGRKLDPTTHVKKGPGRKSRKQKGAEIELANFIPEGDYQPIIKMDNAYLQLLYLNDCIAMFLKVFHFCLQRKQQRNVCQAEAGRGMRWTYSEH